MTVRGGGHPGAPTWLSCRGVEWARRLGASLPMRMIASWVWVFAAHRIQGCGTSLIAPQKAGSPRNRRPGLYQRADVLGAVKAWPDNIGALQRGWRDGQP